MPSAATNPPPSPANPNQNPNASNHTNGSSSSPLLHRNHEGHGGRGDSHNNNRGMLSEHCDYDDNESCGIREVWGNNLYREFKTIRNLISKYNYVAMDTEFPGVVARPIGEFKSTADYQYQLLRCNVDLLKIIQLGFTFFDEHGDTPEGIRTWQFNFKFSLDKDMYAQVCHLILLSSR